MMRKILITGTGMDGPTLAEILLRRGHEVYNLKRRSGKSNISNLHQCLSYPNYHLIEGDILESLFIADFIKKHQFNHIYNTAAQSHVKYSYDNPVLTFNINVLGYLNILESVRYHSPHTKIINFGSSEQFGNARGKKVRRDILLGKPWKDLELVEALDLTCDFKPESVYASSKVAAHNLTKNYRDSFNMWVCQPIMFNHENRYRSPDFVTQKIIQYVAKLYRGEVRPLELGNLDAKRDWSYADDFMDALTIIMDLDTPKDYVLASGVEHSVKDFLREAFSIIGEKWTDHVIISEKFKRPTEVHRLCGNAVEIRNDLGWSVVTDFSQIVRKMFDYACPEFSRTVNITCSNNKVEGFIEKYRMYQTA